MADETVNIAEEPANEGVEQQVAVAEQATLRIPTTLKSLIEALVFAAKEPLTIKQLQALYESQGNDGEERRMEPVEVSRIIGELNQEYESAGKPYRIIPLAGGFQFATQPVYAEWLGKLYKEQSRRRLSQSSIESLSIIAYKQPISKPEIESIRGVNCDYVLKTLLEKELVTIVGRAPTPGRPLLYGTTREFLKHFGLNDVSDLPRPREIEEILGESQFEAERRMLEAQQGLAEDQKKEEEDFKSRLPHIPKRKASLDETVRIVSKKKSREIKIRTEDEAQEPIPFDQAASHETSPGTGTDPALKEVVPETNNAAEGQATEIAGSYVSGEEESEPGTLEIEEEGSVTSMPVNYQPVPIEAKTELPESGDSELTIENRQNEPDAPMPSETIEPPIEGSVLSISAEPGRAEIIEVTKEQRDPVTEMPSTQEIVKGEDESYRFSEPSAPDHDAPDGVVDLVQTSEEHALPEESLIMSPEEPEPSPAPMPDQQPEDFPEPPRVAPVQTPAARPQAPHPKTPWQTWKEKIQGFIKKLFG